MGRYNGVYPDRSGLEVDHVNAGVNPAGTVLASESWGAVLGLANGVGTALDPTASAITIRFLGQLAAEGADTVTLRNFTVLRYPAIANP